jgi:hypothetical protein
MQGLNNISQLYQKFFVPPGEMPITDLISVLKDNTNPDLNTAEASTTEGSSPSKSTPEPQSNKDPVDQCASLDQIIVQASVDQTPPTPSIAESPRGRLYALIQSD